MEDNDNLYKQHSPKQRRINVNDSQDLKYWAKYFKLSEQDLKQTVEKIGPAVDALAEYLEIDFNFDIR